MDVLPEVEGKVEEDPDDAEEGVPDEDVPAPGLRRALFPTDTELNECKSVHAPTEIGPYSPDIV